LGTRIQAIVIALIFFHEWDKVSLAQYIGMVLAIVGVFLMPFLPKEAAK
jgi:multidrug transporter EmrE-like cation transporter